MTTLLVDTHVLQWWSAEPDRLSAAALDALEVADEVAVAAITWYELAWLAGHGRISVSRPIGAWLGDLARSVRTMALSPAIAVTAAALPPSFPSDPADRLIYATAIEHGLHLVTKDSPIRRHRASPAIRTIW
ncbi:MAG: type II toxin-antitoxin system VapC family toxin [bacterium]|nr:type II toxin-antitoxin system VapC family toxin [bacterium]